MSPFDLRGPQFLVFYLILGTLVVTLLFMLRRLIDPAGPVKVDMSDPYLIAFLRGGENQILRVPTISLVHRNYFKSLTPRLRQHPRRRGRCAQSPPGGA